MTRRDLSDIISREFPDIIGAMITGSQSKKSEFQRTSDIDVVLFDLLYPTIATFEMFYEGIKIDCTIVPLANINSALLNELGDQKGILFKMIANGEYLNGNQLVIDDIKKTTIQFLRTLEKDINPYANKQLLELRWIAKYLDRKLSKDEIFLLLCELVCTITTLESYKTDFWLNTHLRKVEELSKNSQGFLQRIKEQFDYVITTQDCRPVIKYIYEYLENYPSSADENNYYTLSINLPESYRNSFTTTILPAIQSNELLGKWYKYFYFRSLQYDKFLKNSCCICFGLDIDILLKDIVAELKSVLISFNIQLEYHIAHFPSYIRGYDESVAMIDFKSTLCSLVVKIHNNYSEKRVIEHIEYLIKKIAEYIAIENFDYKKTLELLVIRYLFYEDDFQRIGIKDFQTFFDKRYNEEHNVFLSQYSNTATSIVQENIFDDINIETTLQAIQSPSTKALPFLNDSVFDIIMINDFGKARTFLFVCEKIFEISSTTEKNNFWIIFKLLKNFE